MHLGICISFLTCSAILGNQPQLAFHAALENGTWTHNPHEVAPYPVVMTNKGGAFDGANGIFTCPVDGVYVFTATLTGGDLEAGLFVGQAGWGPPSDLKAIIRSNDQTSNTAVVFCGEGEVAFIRPMVGYTQTATGPDNTFSGFLLYALDD